MKPFPNDRVCKQEKSPIRSGDKMDYWLAEHSSSEFTGNTKKLDIKGILKCLMAEYNCSTGNLFLYFSIIILLIIIIILIIIILTLKADVSVSSWHHFQGIVDN